MLFDYRCTQKKQGGIHETKERKETIMIKDEIIICRWQQHLSTEVKHKVSMETLGTPQKKFKESNRQECQDTVLSWKNVRNFWWPAVGKTWILCPEILGLFNWFIIIEIY